VEPIAAIVAASANKVVRAWLSENNSARDVRNASIGRPADVPTEWVDELDEFRRRLDVDPPRGKREFGTDRDGGAMSRTR
jgi:hypothetical protein